MNINIEVEEGYEILQRKPQMTGTSATIRVPKEWLSYEITVVKARKQKPEEADSQ